MEAVKFPQVNVIMGADQPGVRPLPVHKDGDTEGTVTACYQLTPDELAEVQRTGKIWIQIWTYGGLLQPQLLRTDNPFESVKAVEGSKP